MARFGMEGKEFEKTSSNEKKKKKKKSGEAQPLPVK